MRWTPTLLAALAALLPLGCVELDPRTKPTDKSPPPEARKADTPFAHPSPPPAPDDTDPVVKAAELSAQRVAALEEQIDAALTAVGDDVRTLSGSDVRATDETSEKLLATVRLLRKSGEQIIKRYPAVKADLAAVGKATAHVRVGYGRARELYLEKATVEDGDLRERYLALADLCEAFTRTTERRAADYAAFARDLEKAMEKVERHVVFLKDFEEFLKLNPGAKGAKERQGFITSLNAFADQVLKFGEVLKLFRDKVRDGAVSRKLQAEHDRVVAARKTPAVAEVVVLEERSAKGTTQTASSQPAASPPKNDPAASPTPQTPPPAARPVRVVPVTVTRCVPTLVPVTCLTAYRGPFGRCRTVATTHYEWRNQLITETQYVAASP